MKGDGPNNWERHRQNRARDESIVKGRAEGKTYRELGEPFGIGKERVRQIWMKYLRKIGDPRGSYGTKLWAKIQKLRESDADH